jgi:hypothetical protein
MRETDYNVYFIEGLAITPLKSQVNQGKNDLLVFQCDNRSSFLNNTPPLTLHAKGICKRLLAIMAPLTIAHKKADVSATSTLPDLEDIIKDISPIVRSR